ncbi:uroporphyrinogen-III synthase [Lamprobacter modestohalophilus]|uniref:uroporphyrinogen-III synthase n=1 Tax=Lamprobacter modestohalophilus TaxID=1064514 RepID=UPI002ADEDD93|nr:uroporphyrinogen-III synthase [Lamprobacter modestohalophilus]MEA1049661.1 uroporphyrinogen-III synthase [Lamprobacter modestohalophilus]
MNLTCPLNGRGVLVTRPAAQAEHLCQLIREAGGEPIAFPTLEIRATESAERARQLLAEPWDLMLFVSRNAVEYGMKLSPAGLHSGPDSGPDSRPGSEPDASEPARRPLLGAVGRATAAALREHGLAPDLVPARGFDSEALLALPALTQVGGKRVLIVRGEGGRPLLGETLRERGAEVAFAEVYRRSLPDVDVSAELSAWRDRVGFITATSDEVLHNLLQLIGSANQAWLLSTPLVVISDRGGATAMQLGFRRVAVAEETSDEGLIDALCRLAMSR